MGSTTQHFDHFVVDRWPELEVVALLVVLDPRTAREVTTRAMAAFRHRWSEALEEGLPVQRCRQELLRRLARLPPRQYSDAELETVSGRCAGDAGALGPHATTHAVLRALADQPAMRRVLLACEVCWGLTPTETASLAGHEVAQVESDLSAIWDALREAGQGAGAESAVASTERSREELEHLLADMSRSASAQPDPLELVTATANHVRRRTVVVAGLSAAAVGAVGWMATRRDERSRTARPTVTPSPGPEDEVWATTELWPARGALSADSAVRSLAAGIGMRLLWADEVDGLRAAIAGRVDPIGPVGTTVAAWVARSRDPASPPRPVDFAGESAAPLQHVATTGPPTDVVTMTLPLRPGSVLVVLSRPTTPAARLSRTVSATTAGEVVREWESVPLVDGVGVVATAAGLGAATRVRVGFFDGGPLRAGERTDPGDPTGDLVADLRQQVRDLVASATGTAPQHVRSEVYVDETIRYGRGHEGRDHGTLRVVVVLSRLPDGAVMRSVRIDDGTPPPRSFRDLEVASVVPARQSHAPVIEDLWDMSPAEPTSRFLVVAPGASRARLSPSGSGPGGPGSGATRLHGSLGLVTVERRDPDSRYRLELWDRRGHQTYSAVPPEGRFLLDLV